MKSFNALALAAALLGAVSAHPASNTKTAYPICQNNRPFAKVNGRLFDYNGTQGGPKYFAGTNTWWLSHILTDSDVDYVTSTIKQTQLQVTRVWGFGSVNTDPGPDSVFFQLLNSTGSYINYAANGIPRLDAVVHYAEKHDIKIVLNFVNNWLVDLRTFTLSVLANNSQE